MRDIADTIKAGERNRDTMVLVRNFCAHARIEKFGGTGMVEQATGLPIGHHSMRCDFAPEGGMASWDLRDAVIDFYDSNCAACPHRQPLRLPNLLEIIAERDRESEVREAHDKAAARLESEALEKRASVRAALLPSLGAVARTLLDDIGLFDADRSTENFERVTQSARLAPEYFTPELVGYTLSAEPAFAKLAARMIPHLADRHNSSDNAIKLLARVGSDGFRSHTQAFHDAAIAVLDVELKTSLGIVEGFLRAGMPDEAHALLAALLERNGDTVRMRRRGTFLRWPQLALRYEKALAARDLEAMAAASREWAEAAELDAQDREDARERRARSSLPF